MGEKKVRKQIYLTVQQNEELKSLATMKDVSEASIIREAVATYFTNEKDKLRGENPLSKLVGLGVSKLTNSSLQHDECLYGVDDK